MPPKSIWQHSINLLYPQLLTSEFHRWYPPRDLSVESIPNRKSKILSSPEFIQSIDRLKGHQDRLKSVWKRPQERSPRSSWRAP
ncbi:MAG: hypothetical protein EAZ49_08515 [Oscillatoriales cyanobacterium]|nr:MAG: hypothetical protein EAZ49_08515 [Oscillatoriales cyanobacterium]